MNTLSSAPCLAHIEDQQTCVVSEQGRKVSLRMHTGGTGGRVISKPLLPEFSYWKLYSLIKINSKIDTQQKGHRTQQKTIGLHISRYQNRVLNFNLQMPKAICGREAVCLQRQPHLERV